MVVIVDGIDDDDVYNTIIKRITNRTFTMVAWEHRRYHLTCGKNMRRSCTNHSVNGAN